MNVDPAEPLILIADDDPDDRLLYVDALKELGLAQHAAFVENGEALMQVIRALEAPAAETPSRPVIVLLDLNMPCKDGREALREIKNDPQLRSIPVIVMTTSNSPEDVRLCYTLGVNSYVTKPVTFERLVETLEAVTTYWLRTVRLPGERP